MVRVNLRDKNFGTDPSSCHNGINKHVEWVRENTLISNSCFITDQCLLDIYKAKNVKRKIAWILEPKAIFPQVYNWIEQNNKLFDYVVTFDTNLVNKGENYLYYPHGRCWINNFKEEDKTKNISIIASNKNSTQGHQYRHEIIKRLPNKFDVYGNGYKFIENKEEALTPYRFSITIENSIQPGYWTEKIVDCFATKTIPLFWGDKSVCNYFNSDGIMFFNTIEDLERIIETIEEGGIELYNSKKEAIEENFKKVDEYRIPEDWVYLNYPFLFN
jgi:hypothetical protein